LVFHDPPNAEERLNFEERRWPSAASRLGINPKYPSNLN
jgi:hypothetical protein